MTTPSDATPLGGDLPTANAFLLEVDNVEIGVFRQVDGLQVSITVEEVREGGQNGYVRKLPGRMSWPNLTFKRGLTQSDALLDWFNKVSGEGFASQGSKLQRSTGAVVALDTAGRRIRSWNFVDMFPVEWKGPRFESSSTEPLMEELVVAHHGFKAETK